jgi:hypothetical protein
VRSSTRVLLPGVATACALVLAGAAAAASHPLLIVSNLDSYLHTQELIVAVPADDPAVSETTMYLGPGTALTLQPSTTFGEVDADLMSSSDYGNSIFQLVGDVVSVDPAAYEKNDCAPGPHAAVWVARLSPLFLNVTIRLPIYVDVADANQRSYASYVLKTCMPSPYVAYPQGAILGARLLDLQLYLENFTGAGDSHWTTVVTPFKAGGGADPKAAAEAQSVVNQGSISTLTVRRTVKRHGKHKRYFAHIHGRVTTAAGAGVPAHIQVYQLFSRDGGPQVASLKAGAGGSFSLKVRQRRTASYGIVATLLGSEISPPVCDPVLDLGFGPLSCASLTSSDFQAVRISRKVRIPKGGRGVPARRASTFLHRRMPHGTGTLSP